MNLIIAFHLRLQLASAFLLLPILVKRLEV